MKLKSLLHAGLAGLGIVAAAAMPAEARPGGGHGGKGGHASHAGRAASVHVSRAAPSFRAVSVARSAPVVHSAPRVKHVAHVAPKHIPAKARHGGRHHSRLVGFADTGYYYDGYYVDDDCRWLLNKARATGKRYWWDRFYECVEQ